MENKFCGCENSSQMSLHCEGLCVVVGYVSFWQEDADTKESHTTSL